MAHFAEIDKTNNVIKVHVVSNEVITDADGNEQEQLGINFLTQLYNSAGWYKQTSFNGNFRKNYAGVGYIYDIERDAFIPPKPFYSWSLNETTCLWQPPIAHPNDGTKYRWDETTTNWVEIE